MSTTPHLLAGRSGRAVLLELGEHIVEHAHPHAHVLIKLDGADSSFSVAGQACAVRGDTFIAIDPWVPHAGPTTLLQGVTRILALYIDVSSGFGDASPQKIFHSCIGSVDAGLRHAALQLRDGMSAGTAVAADLDALLDRVLASHGRAATAPGAPFKYMDGRIRRLLRQMRAEPQLAHDVDACARAACVSRSHFFHLFRESTGVSPHLFFNGLRLEAAVEHLGRSSMPIHSVAEQLGFSAAGHFTRFFRHHTGSTPLAYRRGALQAAD